MRRFLHPFSASAAPARGIPRIPPALRRTVWKKRVDAPGLFRFRQLMRMTLRETLPRHLHDAMPLDLASLHLLLDLPEKMTTPPPQHALQHLTPALVRLSRRRYALSEDPARLHLHHTFLRSSSSRLVSGPRCRGCCCFPCRRPFGTRGSWGPEKSSGRRRRSPAGCRSRTPATRGPLSPYPAKPCPGTRSSSTCSSSSWRMFSFRLCLVFRCWRRLRKGSETRLGRPWKATTRRTRYPRRYPTPGAGVANFCWRPTCAWSLSISSSCWCACAYGGRGLRKRMQRSWQMLWLLSRWYHCHLPGFSCGSAPACVFVRRRGYRGA
mmetsp:Transcript_24450/g.61478  ORF Transcript_24450/g.61478 Transcript_24450/m.61478 type:complete len:323 (+) Transcript_24450:1686-2654(+)